MFGPTSTQGQHLVLDESQQLSPPLWNTTSAAQAVPIATSNNHQHHHHHAYQLQHPYQAAAVVPAEPYLTHHRTVCCCGRIAYPTVDESAVAAAPIGGNGNHAQFAFAPAPLAPMPVVALPTSAPPQAAIPEQLGPLGLENWLFMSDYGVDDDDVSNQDPWDQVASS